MVVNFRDKCTKLCLSLESFRTGIDQLVYGIGNIKALVIRKHCCILQVNLIRNELDNRHVEFDEAEKLPTLKEKLAKELKGKRIYKNL